MIIRILSEEKQSKFGHTWKFFTLTILLRIRRLQFANSWRKTIKNIENSVYLLHLVLCDYQFVFKIKEIALNDTHIKQLVPKVLKDIPENAFQEYLQQLHLRVRITGQEMDFECDNSQLWTSKHILLSQGDSDY